MPLAVSWVRLETRRKPQFLLYTRCLCNGSYISMPSDVSMVYVQLPWQLYIVSTGCVFLFLLFLSGLILSTYPTSLMICI